MFSIGTVCLPLWCSTGFFRSSNISPISSIHSEHRNNLYYNDLCTQSPKVGFQLFQSKLMARKWNSFMKAINGNKTCINVAHWNGGSSHLGKSSKGKRKLQHVKFLLNKHNVDVFGLSEANLHRSVNDLDVKIEKYKAFYQDSNIARVVTYVREDLDCKIEDKLMDPDIACIWLLIGRGRARWLVGQVYREHMKLGDRESATSEKQIERWRKFLEKVRLTENYDNVTIIGDLNINLDPENNENSPLHSTLKDELLDVFPLASLKQTVRNCTRQVESQKPSLLDHSWSMSLHDRS